MGLCGRRQNQPLPLNVMIVLCIWVLVGGLAWADSFDLSDDVGIPHASAGVIVDSNGDEVREKLNAVVRTGGSFSGYLPPLTVRGCSRCWPQACSWRHCTIPSTNGSARSVSDPSSPDPRLNDSIPMSAGSTP